MPLTLLSDSFWWLPAVKVYLGVLLVSVALWPWWSRIWIHREDLGAGLWPAGGIFIPIVFLQLLWRSGLAEIHLVWAWAGLVVLGVAGYWKLPKKKCGPQTLKTMRRAAWQAGIIFTLTFGYWTVMRSADPGITHTEQPMDMMWMRTAMASDSPPLQDSWFAGRPATYYAEGHQALGFMALLFGVPPAVAITTMQILWFALTSLLAFEAGKSLIKKAENIPDWLPGIVAVLLTLFVSTVPGSMDALQKETFWWWWDATRILNEGGASLITEFPFFSFFLGDTHAHLIGIPILLGSVLASLQLMQSKRLNVSVLLPATVCLAWSWKMNPWQSPTVLALPVLALLLRGQRFTAGEGKALLIAGLPALLLLFPRLASGPAVELAWNVEHHTSFSEWSAVFGFLLPGILWSLVRPGHRFRFALIGLIFGMWAVCEVVFLRDVFQNRMNTVFKVYYQIWILMALVAAAGWAQALGKRSLKGWAAMSLVACLIPGLFYAGRLSVTSLQADKRHLHAWSVLSPETQTFLHVADHFVEVDDLILEASGKSYQSDTSVLGTWTAGHTLLGWSGHQQQWRPGVAHPDPLRLYRAASELELDQLLSDIQPEWVLLGPHENGAVSVHPDWVSWMDQRADRLINDPEAILFRIR